MTRSSSRTSQGLRPRKCMEPTCGALWAANEQRSAARPPSALDCDAGDRVSLIQADHLAALDGRRAAIDVDVDAVVDEMDRRIAVRELQAAGVLAMERVIVGPIARPAACTGQRELLIGIDRAGAGRVVRVDPAAGPQAVFRQTFADHESTAGAVGD